MWNSAVLVCINMEETSCIHPAALLSRYPEVFRENLCSNRLRICLVFIDSPYWPRSQRGLKSTAGDKRFLWKGKIFRTSGLLTRLYRFIKPSIYSLFHFFTCTIIMACEMTGILCVNLGKRWWLIDGILEIWFNDCLEECFDYSLSGMADKRLRIKPTKSRKPSVVLLPAVSIPLDESHVRSDTKTAFCVFK